jgi:hypothetical protein
MRRPFAYNSAHRMPRPLVRHRARGSSRSSKNPAKKFGREAAHLSFFPGSQQTTRMHRDLVRSVREEAQEVDKAALRKAARSILAGDSFKGQDNAAHCRRAPHLGHVGDRGSQRRNATIAHRPRLRRALDRRAREPAKLRCGLATTEHATVRADWQARKRAASSSRSRRCGSQKAQGMHLSQ